MSFKQRRTDQIMAQILELCKDGVGKTRIVYNLNLNFGTADRYLGMLQEKGFIEVIQDTRPIYKTTPKGECALAVLHQFEAIIT